MAVKNFKGLREIDLPVSRFVCLIGRNNAGKSSLLQALIRFFDGKKIDPTLYFDPAAPITIEVGFSSVSEADMTLISNEEHRRRFSEMLSGHAVRLVRRYEPGGAIGRLRWIARVPIDSRFEEDSLESLLAGKRPGAAFQGELLEIFSELGDTVNVKTNQKQAKELIGALAAAIPDSERRDVESDLPAGIDNTIKPLLPEPIYIPAVKDLSDEIATKESASFGKLLGILLDQISPLLEEAEETFLSLRAKLNRIKLPDGSLQDGRLEAVRNIETVVQEFVRQNFPRVSVDIQIPPPDVKTVLSEARIWVDDGVPGSIETKGDGLKRAVTFAILRAYVELSREHANNLSGLRVATNYLLLFEEPELYLHPTAQKILFGALAEIAKSGHVFVSTHSPLFFGAEVTNTFVKITKVSDISIAIKPFARTLPVDLRELGSKSRFQIISYETNNSAFFCDTVVLVEGDSELIVLPHLAKIVDPGWDAERVGVAFCRIGGKGNIARYRDFFGAFEVRVCVFADLDCVLEGFEQLGPSPEAVEARQQLLNSVDRVAEAEHIPGTLRSRDIRDMQESGARRLQFQHLRDVIVRFRDGGATSDEIDAAENEFFGDLIVSKRRQVLEQSADPDVVVRKRELLRILRLQDVFVLERGSLEKYYPGEVTGNDKPAKAINFCERVTDANALTALCNSPDAESRDSQENEFTLAFGQIFEAS